MLNLINLPIFNENMDSLMETSIDTSNSQKITYMTNCPLSVINFDKVKNAYVRDLNLSDVPKSNDALFIDEVGYCTFIEFKNGKIDNKKEFDLRRKIFDSMLIFADITKKTLSDTREIMDYILVYNEPKNPPKEDGSDFYVQPSVSRDNISKVLMNKAGKNYIQFGLNQFKNYCFKNVFTWTEKEFEENFINRLK